MSETVTVEFPEQTTLVVDRNVGDVTVEVNSVEQVVRFDEGTVGPQGPQGVPGPPAAPPLSYDLASVSSWTQAHSFDYPPEVRVILPDGETVLCAASYPDSTHVHIQFPQPFTGKVVLS